MKCISCSAEIPPAFIHSIQSNICAGCGGPIMNDESQQLMQDLADAMTRMPNDPQGLAGWLISNYSLFKIGDGSPTEHFHRKGAQIDESNLKIAPDLNNNEFLKRAGLTDQQLKTQQALAKIKGGKNAKLAALANNIQGLENADPYGYGSKEEVEEVDEEDYAAYEALRKAGMDPFKEGGGGNNGIMTLEDLPDFDMPAPSDSEGMLKEERELMAIPEGRAVLNNNRLRKLKAQEGLSSGSGGFRRSS